MANVSCSFEHATLSSYEDWLMFLTGIIPGPKEPKNMNPYIDILVDDMLDIEGVELYDAFKREWFRLKGNIILHVLDYPGQNKGFKGNDNDYVTTSYIGKAVVAV